MTSKTKPRTKTKARNTTVPRLDAMAFKTFTNVMKNNKNLATIVQKNPFLKELLKDVHKRVTSKITLKKDELAPLFSRFLHINTIHSIMTLFSHEPDCLVVLLYPSNHFKIELYTDYDDQHRRIYLVDTYKHDQIQKNSCFWNKDEYVLYLVEILKEKMPKNIAIFRSSVSMPASPIHRFIQVIDEAFHKKEVPTRLVRLYDQKTKNQK